MSLVGLRFNRCGLKSKRMLILFCCSHENKVIGKPLPHLTALNQATGEAIYVDDMPRTELESYGFMVTSQRPHANIIRFESIIFSPFAASSTTKITCISTQHQPRPGACSSRGVGVRLRGGHTRGQGGGCYGRAGTAFCDEQGAHRR